MTKPENNLKACCVLADLGPYHAARFKATAGLGDLVVLDTGKNIDTAYGSNCNYDFPVMEADLQSLDAVLDEIAPDVLVVMGWGYRSVRKAALWALENQIPLVTMSDSQLEGQPRSLLRDLLKRGLLGCYDAVLCAGTRAQRYMEHFAKPPECLFRGMDVVNNDYFSSALAAAAGDRLAFRQTHQLPQRYILSVNRFVEQKNLPGLLRAFAHYLAQGQAGALNLVIAGDGPLREELIGLIHELGLEDVVFLIGKVAYADLPMLYTCAEAFVITSNSHAETWGLTVNEAMAAGLPVFVSSSCGSCEDLVEDGINGRVFEANDVEALAAHFDDMGRGSYELEAMGRASSRIIQCWSPALFARSFWQAVHYASANYRLASRRGRLSLKLIDLLSKR